MTGHGRGHAGTAEGRATVEIRTVNHRYLDLKWRGQGADAALEERLTAALRKQVERGACTVTLRFTFDGGASDGAGVRVDADLARRVAQALGELGQVIGSPGPVPLELVAAQPGVLDVGERALPAEVCLEAMNAALGALTAMRDQEGLALASELGGRLDRLAALAADIETLVAQAPEAHALKLAERVKKLLAAVGEAQAVDPARLHHELALLADRTDITEELVRLRSHLAQARTLLAERGAVGRKLDFLVQELGREINTIGSKAQDARVTRQVVEAKAELEKIREQVQNVE